MTESYGDNPKFEIEETAESMVDTVTVTFQTNLLGLVVVKCEAPSCGQVYDATNIDKHVISAHQAKFMHMMDIPLQPEGDEDES